MFVYKHTDTTEYVKKVAYFLRRKKQSLRVDNTRNLRIKDEKFSEGHFYMNKNT